MPNCNRCNYVRTRLWAYQGRKSQTYEYCSKCGALYNDHEDTVFGLAESQRRLIPEVAAKYLPAFNASRGHTIEIHRLRFLVDVCVRLDALESKTDYLYENNVAQL